MNNFNNRIRPFSWFCINNFPFIENTFDEINQWNLLCKVVGKLNEVIAKCNETGQQVQELTELFNQLQDYVNHYFDNLDVQEEINNKLDEMADSGELEEIISQYLNLNCLIMFNTLAELKNAENIIEGSTVKTLGFYSINDGGSATYKIREITNEDDVDEGFIIALKDENLVAELIIENSIINIKQLGGKEQVNNTKFNNKSIFDKYLNNKNVNKIKLYIPSGIWYTSEVDLSGKSGFNIFGDDKFSIDTDYGTIISSYNDNQEHIFKIGNNLGYTKNFNLSNLIFSTADYTIENGNIVLDKIKNIDSCVKLLNACFGKTNNLFFIRIKGNALKMASSWEIYFPILNFRDVNAFGKSVLLFDEADLTLNTNANITACDFNTIMFEKCLGDLMCFEYRCKLSNCHFGTINFEDYKMSDIVYTNFDTAQNIEDFEENNPNHFSIIKLPKQGAEIHAIFDNIQLNNFSSWYSTIEENNYCYDRIVNSIGSFNNLDILINNLDVIGMKKNATLLYTHDNVYQKSMFIINNIKNPTDFDFIIDVDNFTKIISNANLKGINSTIKYKNLKSITPAYEIVNNRSSGERFLKSDTDAKNDLKTCCKLKGTNSAIAFILNSKDLNICAKIPNGETAKLALNGAHFQEITLEGTGNFEIYNITVNEVFDLGDNVYLSFSGNNTATSCLIDYIF